MDIKQHIIEHEILGIRSTSSSIPASGIPTDYSLGTVISANCDPSSSIGDVVYCSGITNIYAYTNIDNREKIPSIGVIVQKPEDNQCGVQTNGECSITFGGLVSGKKVWLGTDGNLTTNLPSSGYLQYMGQCPSNGKVVLNPNQQRVKLNPF